MADHLKSIFAGHLLISIPDLDSSSTLTSSPPFDLDQCPFTSDQIHKTLKQLLRKKSPSVDHIQTEMLLPLLPTLVPRLLHLFRVCWQWSYTPLSWRVAQVVPIHKKGSKTDSGNFRPISLTSTFHKLFEKCLYPSLLEQSPTLDIAQGGFRESRSSLDQVQCLIKICSILRCNYNSFPTLAFLDIKSTYDTIDCSYIWRELQSNLCPALLGILKNLFDHVQIEIILDNRVFYRFSPVTGVLQGSILSPFLYSIYINRLPTLLRQPLLLGWLPGGKPKECIFHPYHNWSHRHASDCLHVHHRLYLPHSIEDPISFLLNLLPSHEPRPTASHSWLTLWPVLCTIPHELDYYFHDECPPPPVDPGVKLLNWLSK